MYKQKLIEKLQVKKMKADMVKQNKEKIKDLYNT